MNTHQYSANIVWTGNTGTGTSDYTSYSRDHVISIEHKPDLPGSSDSIFRGDVTKHNPEDMLLSSLSDNKFELLMRPGAYFLVVKSEKHSHAIPFIIHR